MIKAVVFDIEGTLVDNFAAKRKALEQIHRTYRLTAIPIDDFINAW